MTFDRLKSIEQLPLFPLPVVLFPGVPLPLLIFEPRYRQLLADISVGNRLFGLSYFDPETSSIDLPPIGHVGCVAEVSEVQPLPDGRSNIMTVGVIRYHLDSYVDRGDPYLVGNVTCFEDEPGDEQELRRSAENAAETFLRIARAVRTISGGQTVLPDMPVDSPELLSFLIAGAMDVEDEMKLELLEMRSTAMRLERLMELLSRAVGDYEERARIHVVAKSNGHGGKKIIQ
jgi:ATP-dependent Lon protease